MIVKVGESLYERKAVRVEDPRVLERIFAPDEADLVCDLRLHFETAAQIAERTGRPLQGLEKKLTSMWKEKGQLQGAVFGGTRIFRLLPWAIGIYEAQVGHMDRELAELCNQYNNHFIPKFVSHEPQLMRTIPVGQEVAPDGRGSGSRWLCSRRNTRGDDSPRDERGGHGRGDDREWPLAPPQGPRRSASCERTRSGFPSRPGHSMWSPRPCFSITSGRSRSLACSSSFAAWPVLRRSPWSRSIPRHLDPVRPKAPGEEPGSSDPVHCQHRATMAGIGRLITSISGY